MTVGPPYGPLAPWLEVVADLVYVYDLQQRSIRYVNDRWATDFGYSALDVGGSAAAFLASILHPSDAEALAAHHDTLARATHDTSHTHRFRVRRKGGDYAWLESRDVPFERDAQGAVIAFVGIAREITRDPQHDRTHAESDARFRAMVEHLPDAVFIANMDGGMLEVNAAACEQLGRTREALLSLNIRDFVAPEYLPRARDSLPGGPRPFRESAHVRRDGTRIPVEVALVPMQLYGQSVMLGVARDLTARKLAEARSREEAELRAAVIDNAMEGVCVADVGADIQALRFGVWNRRMTEITGYEAEEINRLGWFETMYADEAERARAYERLQGLQRGEHLSAEEWTLRRKDGEHCQVLVSVRMLTSLPGTPKLLAVLHDVTERQRLQAQLRDAQRLESIGRLAGAVAHDFNNLLQAILGGASLLSDDTSLSQTQATTVRDIAVASERGADLTRQLLTFSRRQRTEIRLLDLGARVSETLRVVHRLLGQSVMVEAQLSADCWMQADPGMVDQIVMNLAVNARDAMPEGGTLSIRVSPAPAHAPAGVLLEVSDTGVGIPAHALPHIFEPFFTTKPEGEGTGLGLATVYGIVMQHQGQISVDSTPGCGTTFRAWFPRATPALLAPAPPSRATAQAQLRILVVDDQDAVRRTTTRLLNQLGHTTYEAGSIADALAALEGTAAACDVVLTDVALGAGENGADLGAEIGRRRPELLVLYMSGYDEVLTVLSLVEGRDFIQKPFTLAQLAALLAAQRPERAQMR